MKYLILILTIALAACAPTQLTPEQIAKYYSPPPWGDVGTLANTECISKLTNIGGKAGHPKDPPEMVFVRDDRACEMTRPISEETLASLTLPIEYHPAPLVDTVQFCTALVNNGQMHKGCAQTTELAHHVYYPEGVDWIKWHEVNHHPELFGDYH